MSYVPNLDKPISTTQLTFPHAMRTNSDLLLFANSILRPRPSKAVEIYMILDVIQSFCTFCLCALVIFKRGRVKDFRIISLRKTPYGTFIVPNAVWWMLALIAVYLAGWAGFCSWILWVQETDRPLVEWLWYVPLPWLPLALGAFYCTYGFVLTCAPRSPISNLAGRGAEGRLGWMYLPMPRSAWVMNTFMVGVGVVMVIYNVVFTILNGRQRALTHESGHNLYRLVLLQPHTPEWLTAPPTEELLELVLTAWCDACNVFRYCCAALASYVVLLVIVVAMLILYAIPNHLYLMDHLIRIYPDEDFVQPTPRTPLTIARALWSIGKPKHLKGSSYSAFKKMWMMVMVGHTQVFLTLGGCAMFAVPVLFLIFVPWNHLFHGQSSDHQVTFIVAFCITAAFLTAGWITAFSGVLTFDDIFKAVSGLGADQTEAAANEAEATSAGKHNRNMLMPTDPSPPLRGRASFAASTSRSTEKSPYEVNGNTVTIVTETVVHVDDADVEAQMGQAEKAPYGFLSRNRDG